MEIASISEISDFKSTGNAVIIDVRSKAEQENFGDAIEGNVNINFENAEHLLL